MIVVLGDDDTGRSAVRGALSFGLRIGGWRLEPSREKQYDENDQDDAEDTDATVSIAIAVAAEGPLNPPASAMMRISPSDMELPFAGLRSR